MLSYALKEVKKRGYNKIEILGIKPVMKTMFYSGITSAEVPLTKETPFQNMHKASVDMATLDTTKDIQAKSLIQQATNLFTK